MSSKKHSRNSTSDSDSSMDTKKRQSKKRQSSNDSEEGRSNRKMSRGRGRSRSEDRQQSRYKRSRSRSVEARPSHRYRSLSRERSQSRDTRRNDKSSGSRYSSDRRNFKDNDSRGGYRDERRNNSRRNDFRRNDNRRRRSTSKSFDHANAKWGKGDDVPKDKKKQLENKAKPNFALSGKLTEETNTYRGVVIKYSEPPEARKPRRRWRLYPFKGDKALQTLYIHRESAYLIGRDRKVVDLAVDHPSCSKQHAALQYRLVPFTRENGSVGKRVRPYLIDLESANGTFINNKKIEPKKYFELLERDVIKFGFSSREYVLLHENSKDEALDDDVKMEEEDIKQEVEVKEENN